MGSDITPVGVIILFLFVVGQFLLNFALNDRNKSQRDKLFNEMVAKQNKENEAQEKKNDDLEKQIEKLESQIESIKTTKDGEIREVREELASVRSELAIVQTDLKIKGDENQLLRRERDDACSERDKARTERDEARRDGHDYKIKLELMTDSFHNEQKEKMQALLDSSRWEVSARTYESVIAIMTKESPPITLPVDAEIVPTAETPPAEGDEATKIADENEPVKVEEKSDG